MVDSGCPSGQELNLARAATTHIKRRYATLEGQMRIDAYTHFFPKKFFEKLVEVAGNYKDMGKRVQAIPALYDLDHRKKIVDKFKDYTQILSYPQPPIESFARSPAEIDEVIRMINRGCADRSP